jgi:2-methylcitrate dehydratase PrpD
MYAAERLAEWTATLELDDVPAEVVAAAKLHMLDAVGTGLAALALDELPAVLAAARELGGRPEATALGVDERVSAAAAALANGSLMHALDFDDTHEVALVHSSVVVAPVALALGEATRASGADLVTAAIAGYEVSSRIGLAGAGSFHLRGFHPTSVCGVFAAATAAARLRRLSPDETRHALGIAGSQASGLLEFLADGSQTKPLHAGWAALAGIVAASLAAGGATGPASVLEGRFGLLRSHLEEFDEAVLTDGLGSRWETLNIAFKPYPACHCTHTVLDAVTAADLRADEVEEIVALVPSQVAVELVLEPRERKLRPMSPYDAKFSLPYCIGALLVRGELGVDAFTPAAIADEEVLGLAERVTYEIVPFDGGNDLSGGIRAATRSGTVERRVIRPRGGAEQPMATGELQEKFRRNGALALPEEDVERLLETLDRLEEQNAADVAPFLAAASPSAPAAAQW